MKPRTPIFTEQIHIARVGTAPRGCPPTFPFRKSSHSTDLPRPALGNRRLEFHFRGCSGLFRNLEVFGLLYSRQSGVESP